MYHVSSLDRERYFLKLLILNVAGATSFEDFETFEQSLQPSFESAARARGVLLDNQE